ncbi:PEP-CTERM sorting domain-containing protein [Thalassoglobus neptunius]|uniref:PEP-CTERM sorting domain-containing protein n=1 Tax=Thalassoglobus neptunius TaxID=1938619 RepID=UPI0018D2725C|nr:PEP-CTERM sorting domain-containing protein [Thalassoglobus neptunius]
MSNSTTLDRFLPKSVDSFNVVPTVIGAPDARTAAAAAGVLSVGTGTGGGNISARLERFKPAGPDVGFIFSGILYTQRFSIDSTANIAVQWIDSFTNLVSGSRVPSRGDFSYFEVRRLDGAGGIYFNDNGNVNGLGNGPGVWTNTFSGEAQLVAGDYELLFRLDQSLLGGDENGTAEGVSNITFAWGIDQLPGSTLDLPLLPVVVDPDGFGFDFITDDGIQNFDPEIATGYDYTTNAVPFASVLIPGALPSGDTMFELLVNGQTFELLAGTEFDFLALDPNGVTEFGIRGIDVGEALSPGDPTAFVTGLSFTESGVQSSFRMSAVTQSVGNAVPEPGSFALLGIGVVAGFGLVRRRRRRND